MHYEEAPPSYTKAKAIAQIQDKDERAAFLEQAIAQNWSLSEIKRYISENKNTNTEKTEPNNYKERFTAATAFALENHLFGQTHLSVNS